ncbi:hypothetical protein [Endozoicomonas arenosclerae]|uniref:hypothetical protein n=1 Tax=Endozoicomonas arenosclerae TaxID=1633495 RepID=UPI0007844D0F|nr:hypothetical protein [Endozoicomonas arenosclerae]
MSISASIDIQLAKSFAIPTLIQMFLDAGWTLNDSGKVSFLPIGDVDDFNWQNEQLTDQALIELADEKVKRGELVGVVFTWQDTMSGGEVLFHTDSSFSITLSIGRKVVGKSRRTDVTWYIERLDRVFSGKSIDIEQIVFSEHV